MGNFNSRFAAFMQGRNGLDHFGKFLLVVTLIVLAVTMITRNPIIYLVAIALLVYSYFRFMSKNTSKRYLENQKYLQIADRVKSVFSGKFFKDIPWKTRAYFTEKSRQRDAKKKAKQLKKEQSKIYKFYGCPKCSQKIRVPRNRGKIEISCPKCGEKFIKNTGKKNNA